MKNPLVSILITCYNYADYVAESIESALAQRYPNIEVIVIDDGSTDDSLKVINRFSPKVTIVTRKNLGIVYTRNEAIRAAKGKYVCFLDADDYFENDYIEKMVFIAEQHNADVVYPNWRVFGDKEYTKEFSEFDIQKLIQQEIHCTVESLIRTSAIKGHTFASEEVAEDWDFFLGLALAGRKFKLASDCYINYRVQQGGRGTARTYSEDMYYFVKILQKWQKLYSEQVNPIDLPAYAIKIRDEHIQSQDLIIQEKDTAIIEKNKQISDQYEVIKTHESVVSALTRDLSSLRAEHDSVTRSLSYKTGRKILLPANITRRVLRKAKGRIDMLQAERRNSQIDEEYNTQLSLINTKVCQDKFAVVIHLFYLNNWPLFNRKLSLLPNNNFDLYVTLPESNKHFVSTIKKSFPEVEVIISPNRGRDVLPFIKVLRVLHRKKYYAVLKFHSKKSTHRQDGQDWLESMLDEIIPEKKDVRNRLLETVKSKDVGVIGPSSVYYPLTINYPANSTHLKNILTDIYGAKKAVSITNERSKYGFFGGTMFWLNASEASKLLEYDSAEYFEEEAGQIDGTFAHALERLFCVLPEISDKYIYQSDGETVEKRLYESKNIPDWSQDHDK